MLKIGQLLINNEKNCPDRLAVVSNDRQLTYRELNTESNRMANGLKTLGIKKGDRIGILMKNSAEWIIAWWACQKIGAVCVLLHTRLRTEDLIKCVEIAECEALIYHRDYSETACRLEKNNENIRFGIQLGGHSGEGSISWKEAVEMGGKKEAQTELSGDDPSAVIFTSGTTGEPKGVVKTQEMMLLHGMTLALRNKSPQDIDVMLSTAPLYHIGGLQAMMKMMVLEGTFITFNGIEPSSILKTIDDQKVTQLQMLPPVTYERLYKKYRCQKADLSSVWEVCISAGKCTLEYSDHIFEMFPESHLRTSWGSTEACSITCMRITREELREDPGLINSVGTVIPLNDLKIVNKEGHEILPGKAGEALVRSPMMFKGYIGGEEAGGENDSFTDEGWFRTGDIIRIDRETGYCYFLDRIKDIIKTGGESVFALEVERTVEQHPSVAECAAVSIPDKCLGEAVGVAVVLKDGAFLKGSDLENFCRENMAGFKKPRYGAILKKMPVNGAGKVSKELLKKDYIDLFRPLDMLV